MLLQRSIAIPALSILLSLMTSACGSSVSERAGGFISGRGHTSGNGQKTQSNPQQNPVGPNQAGGPIDARPQIPLRVLSYNTFFLPADRAALATSEQRLQYLPDALTRTGSDIIILQEVWTPSAQKSLRDGMLARGYKVYQMEKRTAVPPFFLGNGLMVFTRGAIAPAGKMEFRPWKQTGGFDKYAQKGVLRVPIHVPGIGRVDVYDAHTSFLPWDGEQKNYDYAEADVLLSQITQIADFARTSDAALKILGADVNTAPFVWEPGQGGFDSSKLNRFYSKLREVFEDPFAQVRPQCRYTCDTWDNQNNDLLAQGLFGGNNSFQSLYEPEPNAKLDYVLFAGAAARVVQTGTTMHDEFPLVYNLKSFNSPLSDHFGIFTDLLIPAQL